MAWNPSPRVAAAREIARRFGSTHVVVLMLNEDEGTIQYATYGTDAGRCSEAKVFGDVAFEALNQFLTETEGA